MWTDDGEHKCDGCGGNMQASDICDSSAYDLCWDCCDIENADEIMIADGECVECGKWATIVCETRLCGICHKIHEMDADT